MKQYLLPMPLLLLFAALAVDASAARQTPTTGRVVDPDGTAVAYATVVLLDAETQLAGTATAADGSFSLKVPAGRYRLTIQYLGYETLTRDVDTPGDLGEFVLHPASVEMQEVVVKTSLVRREADRFVMEIAGSPSRSARTAPNCSNRRPASGSPTTRSPSTAHRASRSTSTTAKCACPPSSCSTTCAG